MPKWKRCGFALVFLVPALMPIAAWLGSLAGHADWLAWLPPTSE